MQLTIVKILIGAIIGILIGLTGLGGGVLLLPTLIFGLGIPPIVAVGSDAVFNFFTRLGAGYLHWHQGSVNWRMVRALAIGSIPGATLGVALLRHLRSVYGNGVNDVLRIAIGSLLVIVPTLLIVQGRLRWQNSRPPEHRNQYPMAVLIGLGAGFLVGITSVGSGSIIMLLLLLTYGSTPAMLVGTDIIHAIFLTGTTGLLHLGLKTVDLTLVAALLIGSVPGAMIGTRLTLYVPVVWLRRILCGVLLITGARMLGA